MAASHKPTVTIRPAAPGDVGLILAMITELAEYERLSHQVTASEPQLRHWLFAAKPAAEVLIGALDGEPAGFALFFQNFSTFLARPGLYLEDLYVRPAGRNLGLGAALLKELARLAVQRGCGRLEWAVLDWNEPAIGFYKRLGATPMHDWTIWRVSDEALQRLAE
jgi:GNAT superfamily N-acetyltransferase